MRSDLKIMNSLMVEVNSKKYGFGKWTTLSPSFLSGSSAFANIDGKKKSIKEMTKGLSKELLQELDKISAEARQNKNKLYDEIDKKTKTV